jgi:photosystem II stability/assembly factor-like uncharacterized protein
MSAKPQFGTRPITSAIISIGIISVLSGCGAKLDLGKIEAEQKKDVHRYDQIQAGAAVADGIVLVGLDGLVMTSLDQGASWTRQILSHKKDGVSAALTEVVTCPSGSLAALDFAGYVWTAKTPAGPWTEEKLPGNENPLAMTCDLKGGLWVVGSFSSIIHSVDGGKSWQSKSIGEDFMFTGIQFQNADHGVAVGEFGSIYSTADGGQTWVQGAALPDEFYPLSMFFKDIQHGWVGGLGGAILATSDGGKTWTRQTTGVEAPVYRLTAGPDGHIYALGNFGSIAVENTQGAWVRAGGAPPSFAYLRGFVPLTATSALVAGGGGTIARIDLAQRDNAAPKPAQNN